MLLALMYTTNASAQYNTEIFGKYRVQYRKMDWQFFDASNYRIYHYDKAGKELARFVVEQMERDITAIESRLGGLFPEKINVILYNTYDEYEQTNIGLMPKSQFKNNNIAGNFEIAGDKIVIYFNGNHANLKEQLRKGITNVVMERMVFGESFREIVKNVVMLDLPKWVTEGYIDYVVKGWTAEDDNLWRNIVDKSTPVYFNPISEQYPEIAGKAVWKYIEMNYGENSIRNLLYLTQVKSNLNTALKLTVGDDLKTFYPKVIAYYQKHYTDSEKNYETITKNNHFGSIPAAKPGEVIKNVLVSPRGKDIAYVKYKNGEYEVTLEKMNLKDGERNLSKIIKNGVLNFEDQDDPNYPLVAWSNTGFKLGVIYKENNLLRIRVYDAGKGKVSNYKIPKNRVERITSFTFMEDDEYIVFSGIKKGQSDIFEYYMKRSRIANITDDAWDDEQPVFVSGGARKGIVFLSNRPEPSINIKPLPNELPTGHHKAYFYNSTTKSYDLLLLTPNFKHKIQNVIPYGMDNFAFLSDASGVMNRYVVMFGRDQRNYDSAYTIPVTNYSYSILFQQYNPAGSNIADVIMYNDSLHISYQPAILPQPWGDLQPAKLTINTFVDTDKAPNLSTVKGSDKETNEGIFENSNDFKITAGNEFQTEFIRSEQDIIDSKIEQLASEKFADKLNIKNIESTTNINLKPTFYKDNITLSNLDTNVLYVDSTYIAMRSKPARTNFKVDYMGASLDNSILFNKYQPYIPNVGRYNNNDLAILLIGSIYDNMEDYRFTGGVRLPLSFKGLSYFAQFENLKGRNDWGFTFFTNKNPQNYNFILNGSIPAQILGETSSTFLQFDFTRPFNKVSALKLNLAYRQDQMTLKASDIFGLLLPNIKDNWATLRAEYAYDDTKNPMLNIWEGLRLKFYGEMFYKIKSDNEFLEMPAAKITPNAQVYNLGFDIRYYKPIYKHVTFAVRFSGAHSAGSQKTMYMMGGVENQFSPKFNSALSPSEDMNYAFMSLATSLRGYDQNARNGNTFALMNAEVRIPIWNTISNQPTNSSILRSLQLVAFLDAGSAWEGFAGRGDNIRYTSYYWPAGQGIPTVTVKIANEFDSGLAVGYGLGARAKLLDYFLKFDAAMNARKDFSYYISIGTDF